MIDAAPEAALLKRLSRRLHLLPDFLAVARQGGIRGAAEQLHLSQSALTRRIQDLEHALGVELFERSAQGMALTPFGAALVHHAELIAMHCGYAVAEIGQLLTGASGELRLAAGPAWAYEIAPAAVAAVKRALPGVHVHFIARMNEATLPMLDAGRLDLVLGGLPEPAERRPELVYEPLIEVSHEVFAAAGHPLWAKARVAPRDLAAWPWVWFAEAVTGRALLDAQWAAAGLAERADSITTTSMHFGFALMADQRHLMLLPSTLAGPAALHGLQPLRLRTPVGRYTAGLMHRPSLARLQAFAQLRAALRDELARRGPPAGDRSAAPRPAVRSD